MAVDAGIRPGQKYKMLTVIRYSHNYNKRKIWECICDCGNTTYLNSNALKTNTKSCGCLKHRRSINYKGYEELSGAYWKVVVENARHRNIDFDNNLTIKDAWELLVKQNFKCALSNIPITIHGNFSTRRVSQTASLDRINSNLGYRIDNIQWVHKSINRMKMDLEEHEFLYFCEQIYLYNIKTRNTA